jgi:hypothetical protein
MYFAEGLNSMFATHPPLHKRIKCVDPQWDGKFPAALPADAVVGLGGEGAAGFVGSGAVDEHVDVYDKPVPVAVVRNAVEQVANPTELHQEYVRELLATMPPEVVDAAHDPYGARALVFATLLDENADVRAAQLRALEKATNPNVLELTLKLVPAVNQLDVRAYLPLVDMTLPALRALSPSQYQDFSKCFVQLVQADERLGLFEWTLHQILLRHLRPQFEPVRDYPIRYYGLQQLGPQISTLLSTLAHASQHDDEVAFQAGSKHLADVPIELLPREICGVGQLDAALRELRHAAPKLRARLVDACSACICADQSVSVEEGELLRAICDMLNCPMPPLLAGQSISPSLFASKQPSGV